ncbi:MAG TPA: MFS transporter [Anaeromyxobacter sp.]|nr:MFS transporter [Anaeromyxobacter sp.]
MPGSASTDVGEALPWWGEPTRAQLTNYLAAWTGWVLDGFDFCIFLFAMKDMAATFGVTYVATALSITLTLVIRLLGGVAAGWLADRRGRRLPLMLSILWFAACDGAVAFAPTFGWVLVLRALFGFGMGAEWTSGAALAMESWPARSRGLASGILQGSWGVGYFLASVAYAAVVPEHGWRPLFVVAALPALLVVPIRLLVKEGRPVSSREPAAPGGANAPGLLARLVWACILYGASFAIYYALTGLWATLLQTEVGLSPAALRGPTLFFNLGMLTGAVAIGAAATRVGVVAAQVAPLLLLLPAIPLYVGALPGLLWLGALAAGFLGAGISGVTPYLFSGLFPAQVRARSFGIVYHVGALLSAQTPLLVASLHQGAGWPLSRALGGTAAAAVLLTVAILVLRPRGILPPELLGRRPLAGDGAAARGQGARPA